MRSRRIRHDVLLGLIEQAYAAAETPRLWEQFLLSLAESVNGRGAVLLQHDLMATGAVSAVVRVDPTAQPLYDRHFNRLDPWAAGARVFGPGVVATDEMLIPSSVLRRTEYFNDFAIHYDLSRVLTVVVGSRGSTSSVLSVLRGECDQPFERDDRRIVAAVVPHVQRALQIHQRIIDAQHDLGVAVEALEAVPCAVFLVDADARVVVANRRGRAMLGANDGLSADHARLMAAAPRETKKLRDLCAAVAVGRFDLPRHPGGMLALGRPSDRPSLQVIVAPATSTEPFGLSNDGVAALVFVSDPADEQMPSQALLRELYGLTPAESHVAARISLGWSLGKIAAERGSALETVRRQSKQILAKTGARHRSELVRKLLTMVPDVQE